MRKMYKVVILISVVSIFIPRISNAETLLASIWMQKKGARSIFKYLEWLSPMTNTAFNVCSDNKDPATDSCVVGIGCTLTTGSTADAQGNQAEKFKIIEGYRLTDLQIATAINSISGKDLGTSGTNAFCGFTIYDEYIGSGPLLYVASKSNGVWVRGTTLNFSVRKSAPNSNLATCNVNSTNLDINFGEVKAEEANGKTKGSSFDITCNGGAGFVKVTAPGYNDDVGLPLKPDGTLFAKIKLNNLPVFADFFAMIAKNTTTTVPVEVELKSTNKLKGGLFNGSIVLNVDYF